MFALYILNVYSLRERTLSKCTLSRRRRTLSRRLRKCTLSRRRRTLSKQRRKCTLSKRRPDRQPKCNISWRALRLYLA